MATATARINMRVAPASRDLIAKAAAAQGTDLTAFVVAAATREARQVLLEERALHLTPDEVEQVIALLEDAGAPNKQLLRAMRRLEAEVG